MSNEPKLRILLVIYQEVASHLRATDDKRDRLLDIYITIVLAVTSGLILLRLNPTPLSTEIIALALMLVFILLVLGEVVFFAMVGARKWHAEYVNCFIILHAMMSREIYDVRSNLVPSQERHSFVGAIHTSRAFILVQVGVAATYLLAGNVLSTTRIGGIAYVAVVVVGLATIAINRETADRILRRAESRFWENPRNSWVFSGLAFANNKEENIVP